MRQWRLCTALALLFSIIILAVNATPASATSFVIRTLDGRGNNPLHADWGRANTLYQRVGAPNYADGVGAIVGGPSARYVSNRVFNDIGQNIFSENALTQWAWVWGQFMDHDFGLRDETPGASVPLAFNANDPLETFTNDFAQMSFTRTPAAPGTGTATARQHVNTLSSFIDGSGVYGVTPARLEWLRVGPVDNDLSNNGARLMLTPDGYLPLVTARGDAASAPAMDLMGPLAGAPNDAVVAGDVRANENIALTALHTLFAREHNRIVAALPGFLSAEERFQIARRVVGAELQYITYTQFLPAVGLRLSPYAGYEHTVNPGLSNEFAVVGYRAHSMIHGEFDVAAAAGTYTSTQLAAFAARGIAVTETADEVQLNVPLNAAFGAPDLLRQLGLGTTLESLGERQYQNDEQMDNSLRSVLFQVPKPGIPDPAVCGEPVDHPECFKGVTDLGAIDIARGRDHGMPTYNDMRRAYGLAPKTSFTDITGEATQRFPSDPLIDAGDPINDPNILDFVRLLDDNGNVIPFGSPAASESAVVGVRRTTLAARLKAVYGNVDTLDAFVGMVAERHVSGAEFGELQLAMWKKQFEALRDGDRFFYQNDPILRVIDLRFGIDYRHTLSEIVKLNTGVTVPANVFTFAGN
ncbi:MAG: peroxidase [Chloroflexi bacterium]|nr:MAG: peroxidase [Chloroflexota bacterium]